MKKERLNYILVGIFTLSMIVLLIGVLYRLTGQNNEIDYYKSTYANITGIKISSEVSYGGYRIGFVEAISPIRKSGRTHFQLTLAVKKGWKIPTGSTASIISPGMLSDKQINIEEGSGKEFFKPGDIVPGKEEASFLSILDSVAKEVQVVSQDSIKPFIAVLKKHVDEIGSGFSKELPDTFALIKQVLNNLGGSMESLNKILSDSNADNISTSVENIRIFSDRLKRVSADFDGLRQQVSGLLKNSNSTISENKKDLRRTVIEMRNVMEAVSKSIDSITYNLDDASRNFNEFSRQIRENPGLLLGGSPQKDKTK